MAVFTDADAASQQLLAEAQASASKSPSSSAVLGATLVNAARIHHRPSDPAGMARKVNTGKLKRPSILTEDESRKKVARGGGLFDIMSSPEKVVSKPLGTTHVTPGTVRINKMLPHGKPQCTAVLYRYDKRLGPHYQQCQRTGSKQNHLGFRCNNHVRKAAAERCGDIVVIENTTMQCHRVATIESAYGPRCALHAEAMHQVQEIGSLQTHPARKKSLQGNSTATSVKTKQRSASNYVDEPPTAPKNSLGRLLARKKTKQRSKTDNAPVDKNQDNKQPNCPDMECIISPASAAVEKHAKVAKKMQRVQSLNPHKPSHDSPVESAALDGKSGTYEQTCDSNVEISNHEPLQISKLRSIHEVFEFLRLEERPGKCQTKLGFNIKRTCERSCVLVRSNAASLDDILADFNKLRALLDQVGAEISEKDQGAFKSDAYGYIFSTLAQYLTDVYTWINQHYDTPTGTLETVHTLGQIVNLVLAFKDTISKWDVSVPQRYKGDRIIKDVDSKFIAPLRRVAKGYALRLTQIEEEIHRRQKHGELTRRLKEQTDEEQRRINAEVARRARWTRWQDLHIARMQCEPDLLRRRNLMITKLENLEEKDANGIQFERVPLFKTRTTPPIHWASTNTEDDKWTTEQETILLDSLQSFVGPRVFEKTFDAHCRPGGKLRDFSVVDIVAKSAWIRAASLKLHQENCWDVPEWIRRIPSHF